MTLHIMMLVLSGFAVFAGTCLWFFWRERVMRIRLFKDVLQVRGDKRAFEIMLGEPVSPGGRTRCLHCGTVIPTVTRQIPPASRVRE